MSVYYDENRATVTAPASVIVKVQQELRALGVIASEIGLNGSFHADCYHTILNSLLDFCDAHSDFQFPDASALAIPTRSNSTGDLITQGALHHHALRSILVEPPQWFRTFAAMRTLRLRSKEALVVAFGERCVPPSLVGELGHQVVVRTIDPTPMITSASHTNQQVILDSDIAVIGMSCKVSGAENLEEFWDLLCAGKSQHKEVPKDRFGFDTAFRDVDQKRKWFGNFVDGHDSFDHKFFKKSPRESATMDPQQRHLLQIAYQAVEQSGYFHSPKANKRVGCYIGVCACDYENNIACHAPNAFTATGNLKGFIAGKISHYFGWTGPGLTIDTACSSSAVAIHQACRSILSGECSSALAGGTHIMTSPLWFQNLAGASFLSTTGQCKPFDAKADGYCRGEGVAAIFLKRMSAAVADGDQILGAIAATAVQQNENCTPIFVPNVPSLSDLFRVVTDRAQLKPAQISVVEAHGTGTAVGDPAEYESIRQALGGSLRTQPLMLSSVKGLVGHIECTSGIVSVIKVLLMIQKATIPPQASFTEMNPSIKAQPADKMSIPTTVQHWNADFRAALINNYGASGSNASLILKQSPFAHVESVRESPGSSIKYPFWICGLDEPSIRRYCKVLSKFLSRTANSENKQLLSNVSFNLARQSNRLLDRSLVFSARSIDELKDTLETFGKSTSGLVSIAQREVRPVVLCFGGQVSTFIGLDRKLCESVAVFRKHLDNVDAVARSLGLESIYPDIFEHLPIQDTVKLQIMLFATQYSCARSWIDSGVQPAALVGHSFGELTALCVSQILSLKDTLKLISERATLVRDSWGTEKGSMMAVEADLRDVETLLAQTSRSCPHEMPASIACYNGSRSFTLAGSAPAISAVADTISKTSAFSSMRTKILNVTNAFHCALLDHLLEPLEQKLHGLTFCEPNIPLFTATQTSMHGEFTTSYVINHMRNPVYFHHALQRIEAQFSSSIFLEAGSNSTITSMTSRALGHSSGSHFQAVTITKDNAWNGLTDATLGLWKSGLSVHHWAHQACQTNDYTPLVLPPYQFDSVRHWTELKAPPKANSISIVKTGEPEVEKLPEDLLTFIGYQDDKGIAIFRINTMIPKYEKLIVGHVIAQTAPICPATVQLDLVIESVRNLRPDLTAAKFQPQIRGVENQSPICVNLARSVWIELEENSAGAILTWNFQVFSTDKEKSVARMIHTTGKIILLPGNDVAHKLDFAKFERLISHQRCIDLLHNRDAEDIIQGRNIYKTFAEIVDYGEEFRGLQKLVGRKNESAGHIVMKYNSNTWLDAHLADSFCQTGGIWVNCMTDRESTDMFIANGIEQWIRNPEIGQGDFRSAEYNVFATHHRATDKAFLTDVFAFNAGTGALVEVILGISYVRIPKSSMSKLLLRNTTGDEQALSISIAASTKPTKAATVASALLEKLPTETDTLVKIETLPKPSLAKKQKQKQTSRIDVSPKVKAILAELSGLELDEIKDNSELANIGIDSLMGMEMAHEIEAALKVTLPEDELLQITDIPGLMKCVNTAVRINAGIDELSMDEGNHNASEDTDAKSDSSSDFTPSDVGTESSSAEEDPDISMKPKHLNLPSATVMEAFDEIKCLTDKRITEYGQINYVNTVMPMQTQMCISLTLDAFEQLGCPLRSATANQKFARISHPKEHSRLVCYLYQMLEKEAQLIIVDDNTITRTAISSPSLTSEELLQELLARFPDQNTANKLTYYTGSNLAQVLSGRTDGIKLIFGTDEGRDLVSGLYGDWPLNRLFYQQMGDFLSRLVSKLDTKVGPLQILEMGGGTGGTTKWIVPLLAKLNFPVEYTFTDLAPSFVAAARKRFKAYPFVRFRNHDIEKAPADDLIGTQHIAIASNAVHATHNLSESTKNIRKLLRPDGFLMMVEMTGTLYWVDLIFGLFEGWWFFDDGRTHAVTHQSRWEKDLHAAGYGHVAWTDGVRAENEVEKLIIAMASGTRYEKEPSNPSIMNLKGLSTDCMGRQAVVNGYVQKMTNGFAAAVESITSADCPRISPNSRPQGNCVLVTGATGSLGSHLIMNLTRRSDIRRVICLNRRSKQSPIERQQQALSRKSITLSPESINKLSVFESELPRPKLGLSAEDYESITEDVTHIIHNAWLMNAKWPIKHFEPQLQIMRNMLDLAHQISIRRPYDTKITFQFISSIATVGHWPLLTGKTLVPEERMTIDSVLPTGYGDAKYICELMLEETLPKYPDRFRSMTVRPGQVAGSSITGYWNPMEHLPFLWKSSQTLKALPDFEGLLSWTPVDDVAATLVDLLLLSPDISPRPYYHIDNPIRQPWSEMTPLLASEMGVPLGNIIPFPEWVQRVREHPRLVEGPDGENPAFLLIDFLDENFLRMSCGGLLLDTANTRKHSKTLAEMGPVEAEVTSAFIRRWIEVGFLKG